MAEKVVVFARIEVQPDRAEVLATAIRDLAQASRAEAACERYDVYFSDAVAACVMVHEVWGDSEGLAQHKRAAHVAAFKAALATADPVFRVETYRQA